MTRVKRQLHILISDYERYDYRHSLCLFICFVSVILTVLTFRVSVFRLIEAIRDVATSLAYYAMGLFGLQDGLTATVLEVPALGADYYTWLPDTATEFGAKANVWGQLLITPANLKAYWGAVGGACQWLGIALAVALPLVLMIILLVRRSLKTYNNDYDRDSLPLRVYKRCTGAVLLPIARAVRSFAGFVSSNRGYLRALTVIWVINLNLTTIGLEAIAYLLYFVVSFDVLHLYLQVYKLGLDLSVPLRHIPVIVYIVIALWLWDRARKRVALARLHGMEGNNRQFIASMPIAMLFVGTMGSKKTTTMTDIALSASAMFRSKAYALLLNNDLKFPAFPWLSFELELRRAIRYHQIYNLATCRLYVAKRRQRFGRYPSPAKCWGYDYHRHGMTYDDGLAVVDLWHVLTIYAQLYLIYITQSSLLVSNYAIREDQLLCDQGNFPLWNTDFFQRDSRLLDAYSRHAHILDFDTLRLGKRLVEDNALAGSMEFGVIAITEAGKERGNMVELQGVKKVALEANQKNDLLNLYIKMARHPATVDNFPFVLILMDEQRPESLGADARQLTEIVHLGSCTPRKLALPGYWAEELLMQLLLPGFRSYYQQYRYGRGDNTLLLYLYKRIAASLYNRNARMYNLYGYMRADISTERGTQDGELEARKYFLCPKKIYSKRFATDCFSEYFAARAMASPYGLDDVPEYRTERASFRELAAQNSYFIRDLLTAGADPEADAERQTAAARDRAAALLPAILTDKTRAAAAAQLVKDYDLQRKLLDRADDPAFMAQLVALAGPAPPD